MIWPMTRADSLADDIMAKEEKGNNLLDLPALPQRICMKKLHLQ
jgi:hypothetical protein